MDTGAAKQGSEERSVSGMEVPIPTDGGVAGGENAAIGGENAAPCLVREQDRFMPIANVIRIMRKVLPTHAKISDDAKETIQECVSEYISFITSEANERCQREQRKTVTAEDLLWAMSKLGFDDYIEPLSVYLRRYREFEGDHRGSIRGEPLPQLRRTASSIDATGSATSPAALYNPVPQPYFHMPAAMPTYPHPFGFFGDGHYPSVYGGREGSGASSSSETDQHNIFDPYAQFK